MATECNICDSFFDGEARKPTLLPCYHTFCRDCLRNLQEINQKICPICRQSWANFDVASLPTNYQLIPATTATKLSNQVWCNSCKTVTCKKCVKVLHDQCRWVTANNDIVTMATKHRDLLVKLHGKIQTYDRINLKNKQFLKNISQFANELKKEEDKWANHNEEFELVIKKLKKQQTKFRNYDIEDSLLSESSADNLNANLGQVISALKLQAPTAAATLMTHVVSAYQVNNIAVNHTDT